MNKTRLLVSSFAVLCVLGGLAPCGATDQPDAPAAFRAIGVEAQAVAMGMGTQPPDGSAGSPASPTAGILDRAPGTVPAPPAGQVAQAAGASDAVRTAPATTGEVEGQSLTEVNKQLSNPVSSYWSLTMQFNNYSLANHQWNENMQFQPVLPVGLTKDWNLITRPVLPLYNSVPVPVAGDPHKAYNQTTAFGDLLDMELLSPAHSGPWLLGAGPSFIFPTATSKWTGQGKWQAGPAVVFGYLTKEFIVGVFPQQWWSIGGSTDRPFTSQMNLQPFAAWFFAPGWSLGYSGNILANWRAPSKDVWTVPLGLGLGKVVKLGPLPVKFSLAGQWMAVHPSTTGQEWNIQVQITPVIPKLIKGTLFD